MEKAKKITQEEILETIKDVIAILFDVDGNEVTPQTKLSEDLEADSLEQVEFLMELGKVFDFTVPETVDMDIITVQDAVDWVQKCMEE